jgi:IS5 family transposase
MDFICGEGNSAKPLPLPLCLSDNSGMKQMSLGVSGFERRIKLTRRRAFLQEMERVVPWAELVALIEPYTPAPSAKGGRPAFAVPVMLRIHFLQQWFNLSDPAMEEAPYDTPLFREFAGIDIGEDVVPDESTILRHQYLLEAHGLAQRILETVNALLSQRGLMLKSGTVVDATLIAAPSSTKNKTGERDPEMVSGDESEPRTTKKGNQWYFGMKAHVGVDAETGLVHTVVGTAANVNDVTQAHALLHGEETGVFADAGYQGADKREENRDRPVTWHIAMRPGRRRALPKDSPLGCILDRLEQVKARIRAKGERAFRVIKRPFGYVRVKYRGLAKNTANLMTLFARAMWMVRRQLLDMDARG